MIFLIDSDALIHAFRYDFPPDGDHGDFWDWIRDPDNEHQILICDKVMEEIERGDDGLYHILTALPGIRRENIASALPHLSNVLAAYGEMDDVDMETLDRKADPYLIAHAIGLQATVVTNEVPRPGITTPVSKKIPDICSVIGVPCVRYPRFLWNMGRE